MSTAPIIFRWDGDAMVPWRRFAKLCDQQYVIGQDYRLEAVQPRSRETHNHFFACIEEAWKNLPEVHGNRWLTSEELRKWALIEAGYYDETTFICHSKAEAIRLAGYLRSIDGPCVVVVEGAMVARRVAKSQSMKAMTAKEFQASKTAVLDVLGKLIGVPVDELARNAGRAA